MTDTDTAYLQSRMEQELLLAARSEIPEAFDAHRQLAEAYAARLAEAQRPKLRLSLP